MTSPYFGLGHLILRQLHEAYPAPRCHCGAAGLPPRLGAGPHPGLPQHMRSLGALPWRLAGRLATSVRAMPMLDSLRRGGRHSVPRVSPPSRWASQARVHPRFLRSLQQGRVSPGAVLRAAHCFLSARSWPAPGVALRPGHKEWGRSFWPLLLHQRPLSMHRWQPSRMHTAVPPAHRRRAAFARVL